MTLPTFKQGCLISLAGAAFAFFGCLGALVSLGNFNGPEPPLFWVLGAVFVLGMLALLWGLLALVIVGIKRVSAPRKDA